MAGTCLYLIARDHRGAITALDRAKLDELGKARPAGHKVPGEPNPDRRASAVAVVREAALEEESVNPQSFSLGI